MIAGLDAPTSASMTVRGRPYDAHREPLKAERGAAGGARCTPRGRRTSACGRWLPPPGSRAPGSGR
ncbi:MAG: hypothetical protein ACTHOK_09090 [Nocardioidaceae bacterium]